MNQESPAFRRGEEVNDVQASLSLTEIGDLGCGIWCERMTLEQIVIALGVVYGDIARVARDGPTTTDVDLRRELGTVIASTVRWCGDLGIDPDVAVREALVAQREWVSRRS